MSVREINPARILTSRDGTFAFDKAGEVAAIGKVRDCEGVLVDFVAWFPDHPGTWWLRRGTETPVLGACNLAVAAEFGTTNELRRTPVAWFCDPHDSACILMWNARLNDLFDGIGAGVVADPALRHRLIRAWRLWEPPVRVVNDAGGVDEGMFRAA